MSCSDFTNDFLDTVQESKASDRNAATPYQQTAELKRGSGGFTGGEARVLLAMQRDGQRWPQ